jgi:hypothetical protein
MKVGSNEEVSENQKVVSEGRRQERDPRDAERRTSNPGSRAAVL